MHKHILSISLAILPVLTLSFSALADQPKPRIVVLTDIAPITVEPDDMESSIRLLAHADLFEIEALIATTGWSNYGGKERPDILHDVINAYEKDLPNLLKRSSQTTHLADENTQSLGYWPSPAYLRSRVVLGSAKSGMPAIGQDNNSVGSDLIIKLADEKDDRPLYVLVWGGGNTLAQSVWQVQQTRTPDQLKTFLNKIRVYTITDQDKNQSRGKYTDSSHYWLRKDFSKDLLHIWDESAWLFQNDTGKRNWKQYEDLIQNHGALGAIYPKYKYGVEGDTPSFLYVWPNGLNVPEHPEYGGWGAIFEFGQTRDKETSSWNNHSGTKSYTASRKYEPKFYPALFNSFAARMAWVKDGKGNREPVVVVEGDKTLNPIKISKPADINLTLDASATTDPDDNKLTFSWWVFTEAGTYDKEIQIDDADKSRAKVKIPADAAGKSIHVICEVADNGTPPLTAYRRIIIEPTAQ